MTRNLRRAVPRVRLVAESLENREGPSSLTDPLASIRWSSVFADVRQVKGALPELAAIHPVITAASGSSGSSGSVTLSGTAVDDKSLAGCLVTIRGDGVSETAIVDTSGNFAVTFHRATNGDFVVQVNVVDSDGNVSEPVSVLVSGI